MLWNLGENFSTQTINFVTGVYMARILSPSDYGLMGMLLIFTTVSDVIMNGGFSTALVRKNDRSEKDMATAFYFNIAVSCFLYGILFFLAPQIATFYNIPILEDLTKVAAIPFVINAFCLVQRTWLIIQLDFKTQAKYSIAAALAKGIFGICLAYSGWGVWSIAWSGVVGATVSCLLYWWHSMWKPQFVFSLQSFRDLFGFGSKLMLSGILDVLGNNLFTLIIGKQFSATSLGYYTRALGYASLPSSVFSGVLSRVTLPILSKIQDDDEHLAKAYQQLLNLSAFIFFPLMTGLSLLAYPLIVLMITEKWIHCVEYLQILCFLFMLYPIHTLNLNLLQVKGYSDLFLRLEFIKKGLMIVMLIITIPFGIRAICIGGVISSYIAWGVNAYYTEKIIGIGIWKQVKNILPIVGYTIGMGICIWQARLNIESDVWQLIGGLVLGIFSYLFIAYCCQAKELTYLFRLISIKKTGS